MDNKTECIATTEIRLKFNLANTLQKINMLYSIKEN